MQGWRERLAPLGEVQAFDYPYMREGRRRPDPQPVLLEAHRAAYQAVRRSHPGPVVLAGKSMGARISCHLALEVPALVHVVDEPAVHDQVTQHDEQAVVPGVGIAGLQISRDAQLADEEGWFADGNNQHCQVFFGALRGNKRYRRALSLRRRPPCGRGAAAARSLEPL